MRRPRRRLTVSRAWKATAFCDIDPEDFFDFTEVRPEVNVVDGEVRSITWPSTTFAVAPGGVDVVVASGPEPQTHWKSYCEAFVELALELEVSRAIFLGAYLGEVTHHGPVPLSATSSDPDALASAGLAASFYEGPTGILAVLQGALDEVGIATTSIWASVPVYSVTIAAKPTLALAETAARISGRPADLAGLARPRSSTNSCSMTSSRTTKTWRALSSASKWQTSPSPGDFAGAPHRRDRALPA